MTLFGTPTSTSSSSPKLRRIVDPPDLSIADLASRLQFATDDDTCKGMFFNGVLSATLTLLGPDAQSQVHASLPEKKYVDFFNYPIKTFLPGAFRAATMLQSTHGSFDAAIRQLGQQAIDD